jgi:tryptophan-rich sensory protein
MQMNNTLKLITAIVISELAGIIGTIFTTSSIQTWYATLTKPVLNPPSFIFGPVWTTLYALMGIAAFLVWSSYAKATEDKNKGWDRKDIRKALGVFLFQLVLNAAWSIIFFGLHSPLWALVNITLMWLTIVWTMVLFYKISKPAMWLLVPYILWVSFAAYLNYSIWILN